MGTNSFFALRKIPHHFFSHSSGLWLVTLKEEIIFDTSVETTFFSCTGLVVLTFHVIILLILFIYHLNVGHNFILFDGAVPFLSRCVECRVCMDELPAVRREDFEELCNESFFLFSFLYIVENLCALWLGGDSDGGRHKPVPERAFLFICLYNVSWGFKGHSSI